MEINLKIIQVLPPQEGVGKNGNPWKLQGYVGETQSEYQKKVYFEVMGAERIEKNPCDVDDMVKVSFDIESREYNGRWYTSIRAWKIEPAQAAAEPVEQKPAQAAPAAAPEASVAEEGESELPF